MPTVPPTTTTTAPPFTISASARQNTITCNTGTADVFATTQGGEASGLFLHWSEGSGSGGAKGMDKSGSSWTAQLGTFDHAETVTWWVSTAFVGNGGTRSANHTIDVTC